MNCAACLLFDDRKLRDYIFHIAVSGLLVFAKHRVVQVYLLQSQEVLSSLFSDLSFRAYKMKFDKKIHRDEYILIAICKFIVL